MTVSIGGRRVVDHASESQSQPGRVNERFVVFECPLEQVQASRRPFLPLREILGVLGDSVATLR